MPTAEKRTVDGNWVTYSSPDGFRCMRLCDGKEMTYWDEQLYVEKKMKEAYFHAFLN